MTKDNKKLWELIEYFTTAYNYIEHSEFINELEWCRNIKPFNEIDAETFFLEYTWVVLNAGMREQVARKIYERFIANFDTSTIGHNGKRAAIEYALSNYKHMFRGLQDSTDKIKYMETLQWIGPITKYHLARNIGIDTVKPDRHLMRLADRFGYKSPHDMCSELSGIVDEKIGIIDIILWRYCNMHGSE